MPKKKEFITEQEFLSKVIPDPKNREEDGEYFKGGKCNYGGEHILKEDIAEINRFFQNIFDTLNAKKPRDLKNEEELETWKSNQINTLNDLISKCNQDDKTTLGNCCLAWKVYWGKFGARKTEELKKLLTVRRMSVEKMKWVDLEKYIGDLRRFDEIRGEISNLTKSEQLEQNPEERKRLRKKITELENSFLLLEESFLNSPFNEIENQEATAMDILNGFLNPNQSSIGRSGRTNEQDGTINNNNFWNRNKDNLLIGGGFFILSLIATLIFYLFYSDN